MKLRLEIEVHYCTYCKKPVTGYNPYNYHEKCRNAVEKFNQSKTETFVTVLISTNFIFGVAIYCSFIISLLNPLNFKSESFYLVFYLFNLLPLLSVTIFLIINLRKLPTINTNTFYYYTVSNLILLLGFKSLSDFNTSFSKWYLFLQPYEIFFGFSFCFAFTVYLLNFTIKKSSLDFGSSLIVLLLLLFSSIFLSIDAFLFQQILINIVLRNLSTSYYFIITLEIIILLSISFLLLRKYKIDNFFSLKIVEEIKKNNIRNLTIAFIFLLFIGISIFFLPGHLIRGL